MIETPIQLGDIPSEQNFNETIKDNFQQLRLNQLFVPIILFTMIFCFFVCAIQGSFVNTYVESQKGVFLKLNSILSVYPNFAHNISYLGDARVLFPFVFIFLFIKPKLWEAIIISSLFTLITSAVLKLIFAVPRPAAMINMEAFTIMGRPNILHTSLPSGHAMTIFMVISILLYAFMPKKMSRRIIWTTLLITIGLIIGFSRVAVGAHYPLDVVVGCILGYIMAIFGIKITTKLNWLNWLKNRKFYPFIMLIFSIWGYLISLKLIKHNMVIFYLSLSALIVTFFILIYKYVKTAKA